MPIATAAVPIIAWCSLPMDSARTRRSMSPAPTCLPLEAVYAAGGATKATLGVCWRLAASATSAIRPMRSAPWARSVSNMARALASPLISSCNSLPV
ncbi:Uncharacterised protein [Bordetella pertussis]|nr:Uncharacterised protein [Bordetella pertussis]CFW32345.1 Uncharacterised protein [Bordetella pertussis]